MGNNPLCTSIEQSQMLIKLGVLQDTADLCYILRRNSEPRVALLSTTLPSGMLNSIPAWSLSALINLLPDFIDSDGKDYCLIMLSDRVVYWDGNMTKLYETTEGNLMDAVINTILWLLDKNYI